MSRLPPERIDQLNVAAHLRLELIVGAYDADIKELDEEHAQDPAYVDITDAVLKRSPQTVEELNGFLMEQAWALPNSIIEPVTEARNAFLSCEAHLTTKAEFPPPIDEDAYKGHTKLHEALDRLRVRCEELQKQLPKDPSVS